MTTTAALVQAARSRDRPYLLTGKGGGLVFGGKGDHRQPVGEGAGGSNKDVVALRADGGRDTVLQFALSFCRRLPIVRAMARNRHTPLLRLRPLGGLLLLSLR